MICFSEIVSGTLKVINDRCSFLFLTLIYNYSTSVFIFIGNKNQSHSTYNLCLLFVGN